MAKEYVVMGAQLACDKGTAPSNLVVLPQRTELLNSKLMANKGDCAPFVNVMPFVMCTSKANPGVIANRGSPIPCTPTCSIWVGCKTDHLIDGLPALMNDDIAICPLGAGKIEIKDSGQTGGQQASAPPRLDGLSLLTATELEKGEAKLEGIQSSSGAAANTGKAEMPIPPEAGSLDNVLVRQWYLDAEAKIPDLIDNTLPLKDQAKQAFDLRNQFRTQARDAMSDRVAAEELMKNDPNMTWEQVIERYAERNLSGDSLWQEIINGSTRSRSSVNKSLGLE